MAIVAETDQISPRHLEARPPGGSSVLTVRLGDLREVQLAGSNEPPLTGPQPNPTVGPWKRQVLSTLLFLHTFARAWGLEAVEPVAGGLQITILLLPAPEPPVIQAAVGRASIHLRDGNQLCEAWIEPLEPTLEILQTRDHTTHRTTPRSENSRTRAFRARRELMRAPTVLTGRETSASPRKLLPNLLVVAMVGVAGGLAASMLQDAAQARTLGEAWDSSIQSALLPDGVTPRVTVELETYGGLDPDDAEEALTAFQYAAGTCYLDALEAGTAPTEVTGTFTARVTFRGTGVAMAVDNPSVPFDDVALGGCLKDSARAMYVPGAPGGSSVDLAVQLSPVFTP